MNGEAEDEAGAAANLGSHSNQTMELVDYGLGYEETKPDTLCVHLAGTLQASKHFEKFVLLLLLDTNSGVSDCDNNLGFVLSAEDLSQ